MYVNYTDDFQPDEPTDDEDNNHDFTIIRSTIQLIFVHCVYDTKFL